MKIINCEQRSEEWFEARRGLFTASDFSSLLTPTGKPSKSIKGLVLTKVSEELSLNLEEGFSSYYMEKGKELEEEAKLAYQAEHFVRVDDVGFVLCDGYGCSPDGLVGDSGLLEIKCLKGNNHIKALLELDKSYLPQVQGQLLVTGRSWCDLFFFNPNFKTEYMCKTYRIYREEEYIENLKKALEGAVSMKNEILKEFV